MLITDCVRKVDTCINIRYVLRAEVRTSPCYRTGDGQKDYARACDSNPSTGSVAQRQSLKREGSG